MRNSIKIPLSKTKIILLTIGSLAFVVVGYFLLWDISGIAAIIFFGATGIYGIIKLLDKKIGLQIDNQGITDHSSATSIGLIEWQDISGIRSQRIKSQKFIMIDVIDAEKYISKASNKFKRSIMRANMKLYGTPISISSNALQCNFEALRKTVQAEFKRNKF